MSADTTPRDQQSTIGVDAVPLERYSAVQTDDSQLLVYDELTEDAWIQSDDWIDALTMA
ncbi:hypothetical protein [Halosolutus halophilus]|uniref:hypothetical protein n=1 Tax=Halosolutus halophilus TaxID=1552990 RepID=UPI002234F3AB|nr:hypothetical protein [Halosolutus halophilus]